MGTDVEAVDATSDARTRRCVPKDKAVKRWNARNMMDLSTFRDVSEASIFTNAPNQRVYYKSFYSISAAVHNRIVRARPKEERRVRENPRARKPLPVKTFG